MKKYKKLAPLEIEASHSERPKKVNVEKTFSEIENEQQERHMNVMAVLITECYGKDYDKFENTLDSMGTSDKLIDFFKGYTYAILLEKDYQKIPGALSRRGLAVAISQVIRNMWDDEVECGKFLFDFHSAYNDSCQEESEISDFPNTHPELIEMLMKILERD